MLSGESFADLLSGESFAEKKIGEYLRPQILICARRFLSARSASYSLA
jgi:hypothetical protein